MERGRSCCVNQIFFSSNKNKEKNERICKIFLWGKNPCNVFGFFDFFIFLT